MQQLSWGSQQMNLMSSTNENVKKQLEFRIISRFSVSNLENKKIVWVGIGVTF